MDGKPSNPGKVHELPLNDKTSWVGYLDNSIPASLWIDSGDIIRTATRPVAGGCLHPKISLEEALESRAVFKRQGFSSHTLTGPIGVRGAEPGDSLEIRIRRLVPEDWSYSYNPPGGGALGKDGIDPLLTVCRVDREKGYIQFKENIRVPLRPMLGIIAVAPEQDGRLSAGPPGKYGGNIDWPGMGEGATLYLPVLKNGALVCIGDAHAHQGCGEVCGNSMEVGLKLAEIQIILHKNRPLPGPCAEDNEHWIRFAFHPDLGEAARMALRDAVEFLMVTQGLTRSEAYHLCSNAVELRITQVVNSVMGAHVEIPKALFKMK